MTANPWLKDWLKVMVFSLMVPLLRPEMADAAAVAGGEVPDDEVPAHGVAVGTGVDRDAAAGPLQPAVLGDVVVLDDQMSSFWAST